MLTPALVVVALLADAPSVEAQFTHPLPRFEIFTGAMGGIRPGVDGAGAVGIIGAAAALNRWIRPEILVGLGAYSGPGQVVTPIRIGTLIVWPWEHRLKPSLWLAFAHNHETAFKDAQAHPVESALGLSEDGVNHRSGFTAGLGLDWDWHPIPNWDLGIRLTARLAFTALLGSGPPDYLDLMLGAGVTL